MASRATNPCKVCGTGHLPVDATFCPNCGRRVGWADTPAGQRWAVGLSVVGLIVLGVVGLGLVLVSARHVVVVSASPASVVQSRVALAPAKPMPAPNVVAAPLGVPFAPATPLPDPSDSARASPPAVPARPGDTELSTDPLAAYAGGPASDRLAIHGVWLGTPVSAIPVALLDVSAPDHLRDIYGNLYALDENHRVAEVHLREPTLLARMPIDSTNALFARFGRPDDTFDDAGEMTTYLYPARGVHVRWNVRAEQVDEVVLVRPTPAPQ